MKVVRLLALRTGRLYPPGNILGTIFSRGRVNRRVIVRLEWLCQWKIPVTPLGMEPATNCSTACLIHAECKDVISLTPGSKVYDFFYFIINNPTWCSFKQSYLLFTARLLYMFRVLSALIIGSTLNCRDAITGISHVSVWCRFKSVKNVQGRAPISM